MLDEEAQLSPIASTGPLRRATQSIGHAVHSMPRRIGLSVVGTIGLKRVDDTP